MEVFSHVSDVAHGFSLNFNVVNAIKTAELCLVRLEINIVIFICYSQNIRRHSATGGDLLIVDVVKIPISKTIFNQPVPRNDPKIFLQDKRFLKITFKFMKNIRFSSVAMIF